MTGVSNETLQATIDRARSEVRSALIARTLFVTLACLSAVCWAALALDRCLEPCVTVRAVAFVALLVGLAAGLLLYVVSRVRRRLTDNEVARLIAAGRPEIADALLLVADGRRSDVSDALFDATRSIVEQRLQEAPVRLTRPLTSSGWWSFAIVSLAALAMLAASSPALVTTFARRATLHSDEWPKRVRLTLEGFAYDADSAEWRRTVAVGQPLEFVVLAEVGDGVTTPRELRCDAIAASGLPDVDVSRVGRPVRGSSGSVQEFRARVAAVTASTRFRLRAGDASTTARIVAVQPPRVASTTLLIAPSAYLKADAYEADSLTLEPIPEGSNVLAKLRATRPLASVTGELALSGETAGRVAIDAGGKTEAALTLADRRQSFRLSLTLNDSDGVASAEPLVLEIDIQRDEPPAVTLRPTATTALVTKDARVRLAVDSRDDHGVVAQELLVERDGDEWWRQRLPPGPTTATIDLFNLRSEGRLVDVGDRLRITASAADAYDLAPRAPTRSEPLEVRVASFEEVAAQLAQRQRLLAERLRRLTSDARRLGYQLERSRRSGEEGGAARDLDDRLLDAKQLRAGIGESANAFASLRDESLANRIDDAATVERLTQDVVRPLRGPLSDDAKRLISQLSDSAREPEQENDDGAAIAIRLAEGLQAVLDRVEARESYNELVATLRGLIREQKRLGEETDRQRRERSRSLLLE